jgi:hypothetical protein
VASALDLDWRAPFASESESESAKNANKGESTIEPTKK